MRILRLRIEGFGRLRGEWSFAPDRPNLILDDNERGKSSLFAAITAALYGLDGDRRTHRVLTPQDRWRPWDGGPYGVTLEVDTQQGRYLITRDLERGTVTVFDRRATDVTAQFLEGRDDYPVGRRLLGLDRAEFEKCALLSQGELEEVVPSDEKTRRGDTLKSRLENAADTQVGDTNASEAMQVLEGSLRRYDAHEIGFVGTIAEAIKRMQIRRDVVEGDLRRVDVDLLAVQAQVEDLDRLTLDERRLQERLRDLEQERRAGVAAEQRARIEQQEALVAEVAALESEAASLAGSAGLPEDAESELVSAVTRHEDALRALEGLEARRRDSLAREREALTRELESLAVHAALEANAADRCVALASNIRNAVMQDAMHMQQVLELRERLREAGHDPERIRFLRQSFRALPPEQSEVLRQQAQFHLEFQSEAARLEQLRASVTETLRGIESARNARRTPGTIVFATGIALAAVGGVLTFAVGANLTALGLLGGGGLGIVVGATLLLMAPRLRAPEHAEAMAALSATQNALNGLHVRRSQNETALRELARLMGYRDSVELLRNWGEYARLMDDAAPLFQAEEAKRAIEQRRDQWVAEAQPLVAHLADPEVTPESLEQVATAIRRRLELSQRLASNEQGLGEVADEARTLQATAEESKERALKVLLAACIPFEPAKGWEHHVKDLRRRMEGRTRHVTLVERILPDLRRRMLDETELAAMRGHLESLLSGLAPGVEARAHAEVENESRTVGAQLEDVRRRRADLRVQVEKVWQQHTEKRPELEIELERLGRALERAQRFQDAVQLARDTIEQVATDTHRKWADFLNERVADILASFGGSVQSVRFGEDLDFSVQLAGGPLVSRGKAHMQLSAGARDQLYLAVRLAISEYLSRGGEAIPLLADDVFATSDDHRLHAGMRALVESFGAGHQVFITSCHRSRMVELQRQDPAMFREGVHWIDLGSGVSRAGA
jgi:DNA repair exonuclease SbcCD ATPase subunit